MRTAAEFLPALDAIPHYTLEYETAWLSGNLDRSERLLQNPIELAEFFEWIDSQQIQSYLEVGIWTGTLLELVDSHFHPALLAACDACTLQDAWGIPMKIPEHAKFFKGSSHSQEYRNWRAQLGPIDLTFIDADHEYESVKRDFEINREFPNRFLAFHDIAHEHPGCIGANRFWNELTGDKIQFVKAVPGCQYKMGIGVWRDTTARVAVPGAVVTMDHDRGIITVERDREKGITMQWDGTYDNFTVPSKEAEQRMRDNIASIVRQRQHDIEVVVQSVTGRDCWPRCQAAIEASDIGTNYRQIFHPVGMSLAEFVVDMLDEMSRSTAEYVLRLEDDVTAVNKKILHNIQTWPALKDARFGIGWMFDPGGRCSERSVIDEIYKQPGKDKWHAGSLARAFAVLFKTTDLPVIRDYLANWLKTEGNRSDYFDLAFGLAVKEMGRATCVHAPSLVDHDQSIVSVLDHYEDDFSSAGVTYRENWVRGDR